MNTTRIDTPPVLRYVYGILAVILVAVTVAVGSLYIAQQDEIETRDEVQSFHLESYSEIQHFNREVETLRTLVEDSFFSGIAVHPGAAGVNTVQVSFKGILQSMRSRLTRLSDLQERYEEESSVVTLERITDRFNRIDRRLRLAGPNEETLPAIDALISNVWQFSRLHSIAADTELRELATRQDERPRFLGILLACLGFSAIAVGYLIYSLNNSLTRQAETEAALIGAHERLHNVQKLDALGRLVGGVAHDFNNLLTTILGNTELLQAGATGNREFNTSLKEIRTAGQRAATLTRQLLAFSRREHSERSILDINELIHGMEAVLRRTVGENIELTCNYASDLHTADLDPGQFQQVMINLISNARDAMPDGGLLTITTENVAVSMGVEGIPEGDYVRLSVADNGVGMDEYSRKRIFEPFYTTKEHTSGTGLGLATVHGIVTDSDGHILVDSTPGKGSCFHLYFPRVDRPAETVTDQEPAAVPQKGTETVLVVDDDEQVRRFVQKGLSSLGYRVLTASGGAEGLDICKRERSGIHAIVSDVVMSGINGPRFMASAIRLCPDATAIYMSAYTDDVILWQRKGLDEIPVITKPFELEALTRLIREGLDRFDDAESSSEGT